MPIDELDRGDRIDVHVLLPAKDLAILDRVAALHRSSRAAVISAWARLYAEQNPGELPPRRGGRKVPR